MRSFTGTCVLDITIGVLLGVTALLLGFHPIGLPASLLHAAARLLCLIGDRRRPAWKWSEKPGQLPEDRSALLTHDLDRYADEVWWREHRPEVAMGPGSWGWVERAYASMASLERDGVLEAVQTPVCIVATDHDRLVSPQAIRKAAARLPHCELTMFGSEAHHEVLREVDAVRDRAREAVDGFLDRVLPAQP